MTHHMIGKVLKGRYQIVQSLGAGVFGQTFIAVDVDNPKSPKCVIKQLKATSLQASHLQTLRLRFLTETETLKRLGHHSQIPELISCFEEHERFYLVQEFVEGHGLSAELPINSCSNYFWGETEVIQFLMDVLTTLEFIHSQGVIHCDIKPENLIRRVSDGKLVLIDFGSIQPIDFTSETDLPIYRIPVTSLGYIPPEQFIGQTRPCSDIYAVGMIAIQALTGLTPLQLKVDPHTNEILWRSREVVVSDYLAAVLSKMTRYNHEQRFQTAGEILQILQQIPVEPPIETLDAEFVVVDPQRRSPTQDWYPYPPPSKSDTASHSPLLTGMQVGLIANSVVMGFGVYSLLNNTPARSENDVLYKATEQFQSGDLENAIALVKTIPASSNVYPEAQATIESWEKQWHHAAEKYKIVEKAYQQAEWSEVVRVAAQLPDILYWQTKADKFVETAQAKLTEETNELLAKAYERAAEKDFSTALEYLHQIPPASPAADTVQRKLAEYSQKRHIRATYLLQRAYNHAEKQDFINALKYLEQIPRDTPVYATAQAKLIEYTQKQRIFAQAQINQANSSQSIIDIAQDIAAKQKASFNTSRFVHTPISTTTSSFINSQSATKLQDLQIEQLLPEVNIR